MWVPNFEGDTVTEMNPSGALIGNFAPAAADFDASDNLAIDAVGNVWVGNFDGASVSELLAGCSTASCTGLNFTPDGANFDTSTRVGNRHFRRCLGGEPGQRLGDQVDLQPAH